MLNQKQAHLDILRTALEALFIMWADQVWLQHSNRMVRYILARSGKVIIFYRKLMNTKVNWRCHMEHMEQKMQEQYESYQRELDELMKELDPPSDWNNPQWGIEERVHNWRNYVSESLQYEWGNFSGRQRILLSAGFQDIAYREEWD